MSEKLTKLTISESLSLPVDVARRVFSFLAIRGAGKTYCAAGLAEEMIKAGIPIIVIDPMGVWWGLQVGKDGKGRGYPIVVFGGEHQNLPLEPENAEKIADAIVTSNISCVLDISELSQTQTQKLIVAFVNELRRINIQDRHIFIEEADVIAPQKPMRDEVYCLNAVDKLVRRGGNRNLGCTLISQRSAVVNKNVLTQSDFLVVLRTNAPQDKLAVAAWAVKHSQNKKKLNAWLDSLSDLEDGEAYIWGPDMNIPGVRIKFRERETFHATRENLKRYDASKIKPMDVGEFIKKYKYAFEGKKPIDTQKPEQKLEHTSQAKIVDENEPRKDAVERGVQIPSNVAHTTELGGIDNKPGSSQSMKVEQSLPNITIQQFTPILSIPVEMLKHPTTPLGKAVVVLKSFDGRADQWTLKLIKEQIKNHAWDDSGVDEAVDQLIRWEILKRKHNYLRFDKERVTIIQVKVDENEQGITVKMGFVQGVEQ